MSKPTFVRHHKCRDCHHYPESLPANCYCQYVDRLTTPGTTACLMGTARKKKETTSDEV